MKLRYYMRGIGIGMLVTAIILSITAGSQKIQMSDAEVMKRAEQLGMVREDDLLLTDAKNLAMHGAENSKASQNEITGEDASETEEQKDDGEDDDPEGMKNLSENKDSSRKDLGKTKSELLSDAAEDAAADGAENVKPTGSFTTITIANGSSSTAVAKALASSGLITDADSYDKFLCANGYDRKLVVGEHRIPTGASPEEIARIITSATE